MGTAWHYRTQLPQGDPLLWMSVFPTILRCAACGRTMVKPDEFPHHRCLVCRGRMVETAESHEARAEGK